MRHTGKQLQEFQEMAQTFNNRERLLGISVTNVSERSCKIMARGFDIPEAILLMYKSVFQYDHVQKLAKDFQPFHDLWTTSSNWLLQHESWLNGPLSTIDPVELEDKVTDAYKTMHKCIKQLKDNPGKGHVYHPSDLTTFFYLYQFSLAYTTLGPQLVASLIRSKIEEFRPYIPLVHSLRNPGMGTRHWEMLSERIQIKVEPTQKLTFSNCLEIGLQNYTKDIALIAEAAGKEHAIEQVYIIIACMASLAWETW